MNTKGGLIARACRGPILLITIGSLFAMQQAGLVSFERTWPLLIIVVGLMKLLERVFAPPVSYPPPGQFGQTFEPGGQPYQTPGQTNRPPPWPPAGGTR